MSLPSAAQLAALEQRLGYQFSDPDLLHRALTHRSAQKDHNERLEFLGDSLIGMIAAATFYEDYPDASEGVLSRLRASVVSGKSLAAVARHLDLSDCLVLGESERKSGGRHRDSILADALEALAGAIMLDASLDIAQRVVSSWLEEAMRSASPDDIVDAKTRLQEWLQARGEKLPQYTVEEVMGGDHQQSFRVSCFLPGRNARTEATGSTRKGAEKRAAGVMLETLLEPADGR